MTIHGLRRLAGASLLAAFSLSCATAQAADPAAVRSKPGTANETIAAIAAGDPDLSTLVAALKAAGLVSTLEGPGPFTVFAPTNEAFAKLPPALLDLLLANPSVLKQVLLYHVSAGNHGISQLPLPTVEGENLTTSFYYDQWGQLNIQVNGSDVTLQPVPASNGVIYIIDSVLQPQFR